MKISKILQGAIVLSPRHIEHTIVAMHEESDHFSRKIIHVDMDAYFASMEQRNNPSLRAKPVAVGGSAQRGVIAAASYEARRFGVHSAMPSVTATRKCPFLIFVPPRFNVYRAVSLQIREIFFRYTDLVEPLSLDEAYLDVTRDKQQIGSAIRIAQLVRTEIHQETGLTASAGVSYNKFLAKVASDQNKPDGIFVIRPHEGAEFVASLPVRRFYGVGPKTAERMGQLGIHVGADLRNMDMDFMLEHFGKAADYLFRAARGVGQMQVRPDRTRKSVGRERTYGEDLSTDVALRDALEDFITQKGQFGAHARALLAQLLPVSFGVRLLGLTLSGLSDPESQQESSAVDNVVNSQREFDF